MDNKQIENYKNSDLCTMFHPYTLPKEDDTDLLTVRPIVTDNKVESTPDTNTNNTKAEETEKPATEPVTSQKPQNQVYAKSNTSTYSDSISIPTKKVDPDTETTKTTSEPIEPKSDASNLLNTVINDEGDLYKKVQDVEKDVDWIKASHQFELTFKKNLISLPVNKITVFDIADHTESYIPFNSILLNHLGSLVIGKELYIILVFRNGQIIQLAPKSWVNTNHPLTNSGFHYYYDNLDMDRFLQTLKQLSVSITSTERFTEFWLKYAPIIQK